MLRCRGTTSLPWAGHPVAVTIADASVVPEILSATGSKVRPWGGGGGGGKCSFVLVREGRHTLRGAAHRIMQTHKGEGGGAWRHA